MSKRKIINLERRFAELLNGPQISQKKVKGSISASDLQSELQKDEEYQKWLNEKDIIGQQLEQALNEETEELLSDLQGSGLKVTSVYNLVNTSKSYSEAIPILIAHLPRPYHLKNKEGIVRALAVKEAKGVACKSIIEEYHRTSIEHHNYRWVLGNTMAIVITEDCIDEVIAIVLDETNGESRQMFVAALGKIKSSKVKEVLLRLANDKSEVIRKEAWKALNKIK